MESYPQELAGLVKQVADEAQAWTAAQTRGDGEAADASYARLEELQLRLARQGFLGEDPCQQILDMAVAAAAVVLCQDCGMEGIEERMLELRDACEPQPEELSVSLWRRTRELFAASARLACAEARSGAGTSWRPRRLYERRAFGLSGYGRVGSGRGPRGAAAYAGAAAGVIPATLVILSTRREGFASHDLSDDSIFFASSAAGANGAEGACTSSLVTALRECRDHTWASLLERMRQLLGKQGHAPVLSSSRAMDLRQPLGTVGASGGRRRALLVGISYFNTKSELHGCHADVRALRPYLEDLGFYAAEIRSLLDDGASGVPSRANIIDGFQWLSAGARPGDSLFFHYSGHGASIRDDDWNEEDGTDEAVCPSDHETAGLICDDETLRYLVAPLPEGVRLTCILDRWHGGTILELPYMLKASERQEVSTLQVMQPNPNFDFSKISQVLRENSGSPPTA